ncbi:MAG: ribonuclease VapC [Candidatus Bathyarchaeota archaeon]|nr:ribonuclease VapC [Candidatus Bathyarchaeota archaeon]
MGESGKKVVVLDASAFISGLDPFSISHEQYTPPAVQEELKEKSMATVRLTMASESGKLKIREADRGFLEKVKESAALVGDAFFLSEADVQVLALALELKSQGMSPLIATDDYSIQNVANQLGIKFASLATFGIRRRLNWIRYCPACGKKYQATFASKNCTICGTMLKRKALRKRAA